MKCQILFSGKNKKNISKCRQLKILPRVLSVNVNAAETVMIRLTSVCTGNILQHKTPFHVYLVWNLPARLMIHDIRSVTAVIMIVAVCCVWVRKPILPGTVERCYMCLS